MDNKRNAFVNEDTAEVHYDLVGSIIDYEAGHMDEDEVIGLFQWLYDTGLWQHLQGSYGRTVAAFLREGLIG